MQRVVINFDYEDKALCVEAAGFRMPVKAMIFLCQTGLFLVYGD